MDTPLISRECFSAYFQNKETYPVQAAREGRFIVPVPSLGDGKGAILTPNVKELEAKLRGSQGTLRAIELEAGPQRIPTDGSNVIVINRVDEYQSLALGAKLNALLEFSGGLLTRQVIEDFMGYARGFSYQPETQIIQLSKNAGFHSDVYNMPLQEFKKRYVSYAEPSASLEDKVDITAGYYIKKPLLGKGAFIRGCFQVKVFAGAGDTVQAFTEGAMIHVPLDGDLPLSFIHPSDIDTCYTTRDGKTLGGADANVLPIYAVEDIVRFAEG